MKRRGCATSWVWLGAQLFSLTSDYQTAGFNPFGEYHLWDFYTGEMVWGRVKGMKLVPFEDGYWYGTHPQT